jgi:hypothetical protein
MAFNKSLKFHELCKTFTFLFHEVIESFFKHVIYERHEILHSPKVVFASPQMLEWINSRTSKALGTPSLRKSYWCCFSSTHLSQKGSFFPSLINHKPSTMLHCVMSSTLRCPSHSCHKWRFYYLQPMTWAHSFALNLVSLSPRLITWMHSFLLNFVLHCIV